MYIKADALSRSRTHGARILPVAMRPFAHPVLVGFGRLGAYFSPGLSSGARVKPPPPPPTGSAVPLLLALLLVAVSAAATASRASPVSGPATGTLSLSITGPTSLFLGEVAVYYANASGGTAPYGFTWALNDTPVAANITGSPTSSRFTLRPLADGIYLVGVNVTDHGGNRTAQVRNLFVTGPSPVSATLQVVPNDNNGSATIRATAYGGAPPYQYLWTGPGAPEGWSSTADLSTPHLAAGSYLFTVVVRDANGYEGTGSVTIVSNGGTSGSNSGWWTWVALGVVVGVGAVLGTTLLLRRRRRLTSLLE